MFVPNATDVATYVEVATDSSWAIAYVVVTSFDTCLGILKFSNSAVSFHAGSKSLNFAKIVMFYELFSLAKISGALKVISNTRDLVVTDWIFTLKSFILTISCSFASG